MKRSERERYEREEYGRSDPRRRPEPAEDRHGRARVEPRDRREREVVDDRVDMRQARVDPRDRMDTVMDPRIPAARGDPRGDPRIDPRGDPRADPRANAGARLQPARDQYAVDPRARGEPELYKDPRTGQLRYAATGELYQQVARPQRGYDDMDDRMDQDDIPAVRNDRRNREVVDAPARGGGYAEDHYDEPRGSKYNDYFVPGTGIDREVIQLEVCRYLGNDATVRPFTNKDGRQGFVVRAYRALTSAMIEDLKRDSARWRQEQDRRSRSGRSTGSYAEMKGREDPSYDPTPKYVDPRNSRDPMDVDMDMDDYDRPPPSRNRHDIDPRQPAGRHGTLPVSTGYPPEQGYYVSSAAPAYSGPEVQPRSLNDDRYRTTGGSTPPASRAGQVGYSQPGYTSGTRAAAPVPVSSYRDPRTGQLIQGYEPSYPEQPRARGRHG